jgi:signal transduction histidine kinase
MRDMPEHNHAGDCAACDDAVTRAQAALAAAEATNRSTDCSLATLSHELRGRLHAITGWAAVLRGRISGDEVAERAVEIIERNAWAQERLIKEMLGLVRTTPK